MLNIFESEPTHINAEGVKWWIDKETTRYTLKKGVGGVLAYGVEQPNLYRCFVLCDKHGVLFESTNLEHIAAHIDILALVRKDKAP